MAILISDTARNFNVIIAPAARNLAADGLFVGLDVARPYLPVAPYHQATATGATCAPPAPRAPQPFAPV